MTCDEFMALLKRGGPESATRAERTACRAHFQTCPLCFHGFLRACAKVGARLDSPAGLAGRHLAEEDDNDPEAT